MSKFNFRKKYLEDEDRDNQMRLIYTLKVNDYIHLLYPNGHTYIDKIEKIYSDGIDDHLLMCSNFKYILTPYFQYEDAIFYTHYYKKDYTESIYYIGIEKAAFKEYLKDILC